MSRENSQSVGNIRLRLEGDASVCCTVADKAYKSKTGARSLRKGVNSMIKAKLVTSYLQIDEDILETNEKTDYVVKMNGREIVVNRVG